MEIETRDGGCNMIYVSTRGTDGKQNIAENFYSDNIEEIYKELDRLQKKFEKLGFAVEVHKDSNPVMVCSRGDAKTQTVLFTADLGNLMPSDRVQSTVYPYRDPYFIEITLDLDTNMQAAYLYDRKHPESKHLLTSAGLNGTGGPMEDVVFYGMVLEEVETQIKMIEKAREMV